MKPNQPTLRDIGEADAGHYYAYTKNFQLAKQSGRVATTHLHALYSNPSEINWMRYDHFEEAHKYHESEAKNTLKNGAQLYARFADEIHEVALLDAHQDGIEILLDQPIQVGQQIPVRHR